MNADPCEIINISAYKFVDLALERLPVLRAELREAAQALGLKGTILLAEEGINLFVAGTRAQLEDFKAFMRRYSEFNGLPYKESPSSHRPFTRMLVRIKKEIISMGVPEVKPQKRTVTHLPAKTLQAWYEAGKEMIILDTRNDYEVALGTFEGAIHLDLKKFRDFPKAVAALPEAYKNKPIVTFCTGGIRCEKAGEYLAQHGYHDVYQLDGGILKYFEEVGGAHYQGECFVFDKRVGVDSNLQETTTTQCYDCRHPLTAQEVEMYRGQCPYCQSKTAQGVMT